MNELEDNEGKLHQHLNEKVHSVFQDSLPTFNVEYFARERQRCNGSNNMGGAVAEWSEALLQYE